MRLVFLGTAASTSTAKARLQSLLLQNDDGELILFDTGEDVQRAFEEAKIKLNKPLSICITHMHGDHVIGLPGLLFRLGSFNRSREVEVFGPRGLFLYLLAHRLTVGLVTSYPIKVTEIDLQAKTLVQYPALDEKFSLDDLENRLVKREMKDNKIKACSNYTIEALEADHTTRQSFSFVFKEAPHPGKFNPDRADALGVPKGPLWGKLQLGRVITLKDGRVIDPVKEGIVGPERRGRVVVLSGDTRPTEAIKRCLKENHVDLLVHEATYTDDLQGMAVERKHTTVEEACGLAKEGNVAKLALTHFSIRYLDDLKSIEDVAKSHFDGAIVARDNLVIDL